MLSIKLLFASPPEIEYTPTTSQFSVHHSVKYFEKLSWYDGATQLTAFVYHTNIGNNVRHNNNIFFTVQLKCISSLTLMMVDFSYEILNSLTKEKKA